MTLTITVGIPGCGKSTLARTLKEAGLVDIVLSSDDIREELTGNIENQQQNRQVFQVLHSRVAAALGQDLNVLVDATNLKPSYRNDLRMVAMGQSDLIDCRAIRFADSADFAICQGRNVGRERVVPEFVMERFHTMFLQHCSLDLLIAEGWDAEDWPRGG